MTDPFCSLPQRGRVGVGESGIGRNGFSALPTCPHPRPPPLGEGAEAPATVE